MRARLKVPSKNLPLVEQKRTNWSRRVNFFKITKFCQPKSKAATKMNVLRGFQGHSTTYVGRGLSPAKTYTGD